MHTPTTAHHNSFGAVLKNRRFMLLWIGQLFSQLADKILLVLQIALLSKYLTASQIDANGRFYLYMAFTIPAILFGSLGGVIVDRVPKKVIMVGSDAIRGVLTLLIPFLPHEESSFTINYFYYFYRHTVLCPYRASNYPLISAT